MASNIRDARDSQLGGKAIYEEWMEGFELAWLDMDPGEMITEMVGEMLEKMPPEVHDKLREIDPQAYDETMDMLEGGKNANKISRKLSRK